MQEKLSFSKDSKLFPHYLYILGSNWLSSFKFNGTFIPALPTNTPKNMPDLIAIKFAYTHQKFKSSVGIIKAKNEVFDIIKKHQVERNGF